MHSNNKKVKNSSSKRLESFLLEKNLSTTQNSRQIIDLSFPFEIQITKIQLYYLFFAFSFFVSVSRQEFASILCVAYLQATAPNERERARLMAVQIVPIESVGSRCRPSCLEFPACPLARCYLARARRRLQKRKFPARLFAIPLKSMKTCVLSYILP